MKTFTYFLRDETGAVSVDWVVLTAAVSLLAVLVVGILSTGPTNIALSISNQLATVSP